VKEFCRDPKNKQFTHRDGNPRNLDEIKTHINMLEQYNKLVLQFIVDETFGLCHIDSKNEK
jgi:hypothetical protein